MYDDEDRTKTTTMRQQRNNDEAEHGADGAHDETTINTLFLSYIIHSKHNHAMYYLLKLMCLQRVHFNPSSSALDWTQSVLFDDACGMDRPVF